VMVREWEADQMTATKKVKTPDQNPRKKAAERNKTFPIIPPTKPRKFGAFSLYFRPFLRFFDRLVELLRNFIEVHLQRPYFAGFVNSRDWHQI